MAWNQGRSSPTLQKPKAVVSLGVESDAELGRVASSQTFRVESGTGTREDWRRSQPSLQTTMGATALVDKGDVGTLGHERT